MKDIHLRFAREYLTDLNAAKAYRRAGFKCSDKVVTACASRLLATANVQSFIQAEMAKRAKRTDITADRVLAELALIGFANMADYMRIVDSDPVIDLSGMTREQAAAISEVTVEDFKDGRGADARDVRRIKFKLSDKRAALVDIGKHLGMFKDKGEDETEKPTVVQVIVNGVDMSKPSGEPAAS